VPTGANARAGPACTTHTGITVFTGHGLTQILVRQQVRLRIGARTAHLPEFPERIVERSDEVFGRSAPRHPDGLVSPTDVVQYSVLGRMIEVVLGNFEVGVVFFSRLGDHIEYVLEGNEVGVDSS